MRIGGGSNSQQLIMMRGVGVHLSSSQSFWLPFIFLLMSPVLPTIVSISSGSGSTTTSHRQGIKEPCLSLPDSSDPPRVSKGGKDESLSSFPGTLISSKYSPISLSSSPSKSSWLSPQQASSLSSTFSTFSTISSTSTGRGGEEGEKGKRKNGQIMKTNLFQFTPDSTSNQQKQRTMVMAMAPGNISSTSISVKSSSSSSSNWGRNNHNRHHRDNPSLSSFFPRDPSKDFDKVEQSQPQPLLKFPAPAAPLPSFQIKSKFTVDPNDPSSISEVMANDDDDDDDNDAYQYEPVVPETINWAVTFPPDATCRYRNDQPPFIFQLETCAFCYNYMRNKISLFGHPSKKMALTLIIVTDPVTGIPRRAMGLRNGNESAVPANITDLDSPVYSTFANPAASRKWVDCCLAAERCCKKIYKVRTPNAPLSQLQLDVNSGKKCPSTWDGWQCWDATPNGTDAEAACPHYIYFMTEPPSCITSVPKVCDHDGQWHRKNMSGSFSEWTNYGTCAAVVIQVQKQRANVHVAAYFVSIIALIPALFVFFVYKQLRVHRIILHQNLFFSLLINSLLMLAFKNFVILNELSSDGRTSIINENGIGCRLLFILTKYSRMTNYMWMFCEGYYLHKLISAAFAEQKSLLVFYLLGWVFPIIPTFVYAGLRLYQANDQCWVVPHDSFEWVLNFPSLLSLLINLGFLINIIRVLVTKIAAQSGANEPSQYRKAVRATLVLLPLFGLHFVVTIYRPPSGSGSCEWIELYYYINYVMDGLQGFFCSMIFCYSSNEVVALFKRTYSRWREQRNAGGCHSGGSRTNNRNDHGRSMYTFVPASPEPGSVTRLTITNSEMSSIGGPISVTVNSQQSDGLLITPAGTNLGGDGGGSKPCTNGKLSLLGTNTADSGSGEKWSEINLGVGSDESLEMKQAFSLNPNSSPAPVPVTASTMPTMSMTTTTTTTAVAAPLTTTNNTKNGGLGEHQL